MRVNTLRYEHRSEFHHRNTRIISFPNNKNDIAHHNDRNRIKINHILHAVSASSSSSSTNDYAADYLQHMKFTNVKSTTRTEDESNNKNTNKTKNGSQLCLSMAH